MANDWETLKSKSDIKALFRTGKKLYFKNLTIYFLKNSKNQIRFLFCPDKTSPKAVQRNRVKRVLRAHIQTIDLSKVSNLDIALIAKKSFAEMNFEQRKIIFNNLILKLKDE
ncbi:MAG: ribonuclease P protein component [Leptospiraceae bacterium]|nr:ribonuclease P protein component [Leptospiraceae bacterium]